MANMNRKEKLSVWVDIISHYCEIIERVIYCQCLSKANIYVTKAFWLVKWHSFRKYIYICYECLKCQNQLSNYKSYDTMRHAWFVEHILTKIFALTMYGPHLRCYCESCVSDNGEAYLVWKIFKIKYRTFKMFTTLQY